MRPTDSGSDWAFSQRFRHHGADGADALHQGGRPDLRNDGRPPLRPLC